jgi:hypothetical protein
MKAAAVSALSLVAIGALCALAISPYLRPRALLQKSPSLAALAQAEDAKFQALWNAAGNDEIRMNKQGRLERHEMTQDEAELLKIDPEVDSDRPHTARVTTATKTVFHPLRWMRSQTEPNAVRSHSTAMKAARMQKLWNAADNDKVQLNSDDSDSPPAIKWLHDQHDEAEMSALLSRPHYGFGKNIFAHGQDHANDAGGDYVDDNSIGVKVNAKFNAKLTHRAKWDDLNV